MQNKQIFRVLAESNITTMEAELAKIALSTFVFEDLTVYVEKSRQTCEQALSDLAQKAQALDMGY
jgi:hypothetical protein